MKEKDFQLYVVNLPIRENKDENIKLYSDFFEYIFNRRKPVQIGVDKGAIIRTMTKAEGSNAIYYGHITSFTKVGDKWFDSKNMKAVKRTMPKHLFANPKESYYFFIPKFHRIVILKASGGITLTNAMKFFNGIKKLKKYDFDVHAEVSKNAIKEILTADVVKSLTIQFSYSNADIGDAAFEFVDQDLKKSNTESIKLTASTKSKDGIDINKSKILKGGVELSQSYGSTEASIIHNKIAKRIKTEDYPYVMELKGNLGDFQAFYTKIYNKLSQYLT